MSAPERTPFLPNIFFLLLVTPDIPPVSGKNDAIKRLSSLSYLKKKLQGNYRKELVYVLMRNLLLNTSYCNKNQNIQNPVSRTVYICGFYPSKLGLHPEMLQTLAYIIKLLKITKRQKDKNRLVDDVRMFFVVCIFMFYILANWWFNTHLTSSLNLADLPFLFTMPVTTVSAITFYLKVLFLNFGM